ncbi:MAG TPA: hypothetical protein V6D15_06560 [Oculatellaceae cyanobacterium]|jgi:hypothetical protein
MSLDQLAKEIIKFTIISLTAIVFIASVGIPCLFVAWYIASYTAHNHQLSKYKDEFRKIIHPPNTSSVAFESRVERPTGNGDNCFYFVGELRHYWGKRATIEAFYAGQEVEFEFLNRGKFSQRVPYGFDNLSLWSISSVNYSDNLYVVYTLNSDFEEFASMDLRCH